MSKAPHPLWFPVRRILWEQWDPIGGGVPEDEYDFYIWPIIRLITSGTTEQLARYLNWAREVHMEVGEDKSADELIAAQLAALPHKETVA